MRILKWVQMILMAGGMLAAFASELAALSLGPIKVWSNFGERFNAEVILKDPDGGVRVSLGSPQDYEKLGLKRPSLVDELRIERPLEPRPKGKAVRVVSGRPLFYPSFHLVIRAEKDEGVLLESYLVAVDFHKSMTLGRREKPSVPKPPTPVAPEIPDILDEGEAEEPVKAAVPPPPPQPPKLLPAEAGIPVPQAKRTFLPIPVVVVKRAPKPAPPVETAAAPEKESIRVQQPSETPVSRPIPIVTEKSADTAPVPRDRVKETPPVNTYGPILPGDSLLKISIAMDYHRSDAKRFAVALWMENRDKFAHGNLHGIRVGKVLSLDGVSERMAELDAAQAEKIIQNQWKEWKNRKKIPYSVKRDDSGKVVEVQLPSESNPDSAGMFALLENWKNSWEAGDLNRHMEYFLPPSQPGKRGRYAYLEGFKKRMFERHRNVKIRIDHPAIVRKKGYWLVSFDQGFSSDNITSFGRKTLKLVYENSRWKIANERFRVKWSKKPGKNVPEQPMISKEGEMNAPYVIQVSTHPDLASATDRVNQLRRKGYGAYSSPLTVADGKKNYQVFVGRFSDWDFAEQMTQSLRRLRIGKGAIPMRYPYTLEVASFTSDEEAVEFIKSLRSRGFSSYLFRTKGEKVSAPVVRVMVGAYDDKEDAEMIGNDLKYKEIPYTLSAP